MYQDSDPFIKIIKGWDIKIDNLKQLEQYMEEKEKLTDWWPENFDSLSTGMVRMKNISKSYITLRNAANYYSGSQTSRLTITHKIIFLLFFKNNLGLFIIG